MKFPLVKFSSGKREIVEVTKRCNNKHVCPTCMRWEYKKFRLNLTRALDFWYSTHGAIYTQTLTLPNRKKRLVFKHEDLAKVWQAVGKSKRYSKLKAKYGMAQYLRVTEDNLDGLYSFPHFHLTWFFDSYHSQEQLKSYCKEFADLWASTATALGIRGCQAVRQWSGPIVGTNKNYASYLGKHGYLSLSFDPLDNSRAHVPLKPLDYLRVLVATGEWSRIETWLDYEQATCGLHRTQTSRNFNWGCE